MSRDNRDKDFSNVLTLGRAEVKNEKRGNAATILLVEDEVLLGMGQSIQLNKLGYEVLHALNSQEAIEIVENNPAIGLILMDINLGPGMNGTDTAKLILKNHGIPILFLSSHAEQDIVDQTENISCYSYCLKNSGIAVLDACIKMALRLHNAYLEVNNQKNDLENLKNELVFYEKRYRRLFETAKDGILILNAGSAEIDDVNPFLIEMLGYTKEQFLKKKIWDLGAFKNIQHSKELFKELQEKEYVRYTDLPLKASNGDLIHVEFVSNVYLVDGQKVVQCNIRDITARRKKEKNLTNRIEENEALLKEIQHRIKNSFTIITSLISLKTESAQNSETKEVLKELIHRVRSISDLYLLLYETNTVFEIQLDMYCEKIIKAMFSLEKYYTINKKLESIIVPTKKAGLIGMILVELLSNAIKYAFPESKRSVITIELKKAKLKTVLSVEDNGIGLDKDFDISSGLHLVNLMVSQLDGEIINKSKKGTKIEIVFSQ